MAAADVQVWLNQILSARYGEDVRQSIYNSIKFFNQEVVRFDYELNDKASQINQDANRAEASKNAAQAAQAATEKAQTTAVKDINDAKNAATNAVKKAGTDAQAAIAEDVQEVSDMTEANRKIQEGIQEIVEEGTKGYVKKTGDTITGVVKAPTPTSSSDPKQVATKEYVDSNAGSGGGSGAGTSAEISALTGTSTGSYKVASAIPAASVSTSFPNPNIYATFLVLNMYQGLAPSGILHVFVRAEKNTKVISDVILSWDYVTENTNLDDFTLAYKDYDNPIELYYNNSTNYKTVKFVLLDSNAIVNINDNTYSTWSLYTNTKGTPASSYTQIKSTMGTIDAKLKNYLHSNDWARFQKRKSTNSFGPVWCSTANSDKITGFLYAYLLQSSASDTPVLRFDRYVTDENEQETGNAQPIILDNIDPTTLFKIIQKYNWVYDEKLFGITMQYMPVRIKITTNNAIFNNKYMKLVEIDSGSAGMIRIQGHLSEYTTVNYVDISLRGATINNSTTAESLMIIDNSYGRFNSAYLNLLIVNENDKATVYIKKGTYNWVACNLTISTSLNPSLVHVTSNVSWVNSLPDNATVLYDWYAENTKHYSTTKYPVFSSTQNAEIFSPANNAGAHNSIFRGNNLGTSITAAQYKAIDAGTFEDLYIGDYWENGGINWIIAGFNYWYDVFNQNLVNHIIVVPNIRLGTTMYMSGTLTNFYLSTINTYKSNSSIKSIINSFVSDSDMLAVKYPTYAGIKSANGLYEYSDSATIETAIAPLTARMLFGQLPKDAMDMDSLIAKQMPLFSLAPQYMSVGNTYFLMDLRNKDNYTAYIHDGKSVYYSQTNMTQGYRPFIVIKGKSTSTASLNAIPDAAPSLE